MCVRTCMYIIRNILQKEIRIHVFNKYFSLGFYILKFNQFQHCIF